MEQWQKLYKTAVDSGLGNQVTYVQSRPTAMGADIISISI